MFSYLSESVLFIGLLVVGRGLNYFFLKFRRNSDLIKVYLVIIFFLVFLKIRERVFSVVQNFKYFNGGLWVKIRSLGTFFFEVLDKGLFLGVKFLREMGFKICSLFKKVKSLNYFFFFKGMLFSLVVVICLLLFVVL